MLPRLLPRCRGGGGGGGAIKLSRFDLRLELIVLTPSRFFELLCGLLVLECRAGGGGGALSFGVPSLLVSTRMELPEAPSKLGRFGLGTVDKLPSALEVAGCWEAIPD